MVFNARTQRGLIWFLMAINVPLIPMTISDGIIYFQIILIAFILLCLFIQFQFKIVEGSLSFETLIFAIRVYRKEVLPSQIVEMKFKRVGWGRKCVVVQTNKGLNLRIVNFYPEKIYIDLIDYAKQYDISLSKTRDYLILEKLE